MRVVSDSRAGLSLPIHSAMSLHPSLFLASIASAAVLSAGTGLAQQRVPWTTSHIHGTPEPPPPYVVERFLPALTFQKPLDISPLPGTDRLVVLQESGVP